MDMSVLWTFWLPALGLSALAVALVALVLWRRGAASGSAEDRRAVRIYADQLREIERDAGRGLIAPDEAERLRTETARRLLDADRAPRSGAAPSPRGARVAALVMVALVPVIALAVYWAAGAPMRADRPLALRHAEAASARAARPSQAEMEAAWAANPARPEPPPPTAEYAALMDQLRAVVAQRPDDPTGLRFLAVNEGQLGNSVASATAWARLVTLQGQDAPIDDMLALADAMVTAAGGMVSPEADAVLQQVLARDPRNGPARYMLGLSLLETGRPDMTFRLWRGLLEDSPPDAPWMVPIMGMIEELASIAGVRYEPPALAGSAPMAGGRGPTADDIAAARDMSEEDRQAMIASMVAGLEMRLSTRGGPVEEWARLIGALGVLGELDRARAILAEARGAFAGDDAAQGALDAAARRAGLDG